MIFHVDKQPIFVDETSVAYTHPVRMIEDPDRYAGCTMIYFHNGNSVIVDEPASYVAEELQESLGHE